MDAMTEQENQPQEATSAPENAIESVRDLIEMMTSGGIGELDLKTEDFKIRLRTEAVALATATPVMSMTPTYAMPPMPGMTQHATSEAEPDSTSAKSERQEGHVVTSPMIGTFYSASAPGEPAYAQVGDEVETGQVIGIIEAMKIMNEITADKSGVIVEILVDNAEAVEYGSPLVRISSSAQLD
jgi:acetyl-CoA carboxylase biotin carboxyl carrier protein